MIGDRVFPQEAREWTRRSIEEIILSLTPKVKYVDGLRMNHIKMWCNYIDNKNKIHLFPYGQTTSFKYHKFYIRNNEVTLTDGYFPVFILEKGNAILNGVTIRLWDDFYDKLHLSNKWKKEVKNVTVDYELRKYDSTKVNYSYTKECVVFSYPVEQMTYHENLEHPEDSYYTIDDYPDRYFDEGVGISGISCVENEKNYCDISDEIKLFDMMTGNVYDYSYHSKSMVKPEYNSQTQQMVIHSQNTFDDYDIRMNASLVKQNEYVRLRTLNGGARFIMGFSAWGDPNVQWQGSYEYFGIVKPDASITPSELPPSNITAQWTASDTEAKRIRSNTFNMSYWNDLMYIGFPAMTGTYNTIYEQVFSDLYVTDPVDFKNIAIHQSDTDY